MALGAHMCGDRERKRERELSNFQWLVRARCVDLASDRTESEADRSRYNSRVGFVNFSDPVALASVNLEDKGLPLVGDKSRKIFA